MLNIIWNVLKTKTYLPTQVYYKKLKVVVQGLIPKQRIYSGKKEDTKKEKAMFG